MLSYHADYVSAASLDFDIEERLLRHQPCPLGKDFDWAKFLIEFSISCFGTTLERIKALSNQGLSVSSRFSRDSREMAKPFVTDYADDFRFTSSLSLGGNSSGSTRYPPLFLKMEDICSKTKPVPTSISKQRAVTAKMSISMVRNSFRGG